MKKLTDSKRAINIVDSTTPFMYLDLGQDNIQLYNTPKGSYGYQVLAVVRTPGEDAVCAITEGYGYGKDTHALHTALRHLGRMPKGYRGEGAGMPCGYKAGGNYYHVPRSKVRKLK